MVTSFVKRTSEWVLLAYRLPREPSTPRIALWRKLKRLGAGQLSDGLVALPLDGRTKEQMEWSAEEVIEAGGEASIWTARPGTAAQERVLARTMTDAIADEYRLVINAANTAQEDRANAHRTLARLRRELRRIRARDFFPPPERKDAESAVEALGTALEVAP
ncbi:MAG: Chromate resistance protein ChrB [Dehalococcoidia bacterium]